VLRTSVSDVSLAVTQTRDSDHFVSIWEATFLYKHPCLRVSGAIGTRCQLERQSPHTQSVQIARGARILTPFRQVQIPALGASAIGATGTE